MNDMFPVHLTFNLPRRIRPGELSRRLAEASRSAAALVKAEGYSTARSVLADLEEDDATLTELETSVGERLKEWRRLRRVVQAAVQIRGGDTIVSEEDIEPLGRIQELQRLIEPDHTAVGDGDFHFDGFFIGGPGTDRDVFAEAGTRWADAMAQVDFHVEQAEAERDRLRRLGEQVRIRRAALLIALFAARAEIDLPEIPALVKQLSQSDADRARLVAIQSFVQDALVPFQDEPDSIEALCNSRAGFRGDKTEFKHAVGNAIGMSGAVAYRVLIESGLWVKGRKGAKGEGLYETVQNILNLGAGA